MYGFSLTPYGAPEHRRLEPDQPRGAREGSRAATKAQGGCLLSPPAPGGDARARHPGALFFGFFLLGKQKKETRLRGETRSKLSRRQWRLPFLYNASRCSDRTSKLKNAIASGPAIARGRLAENIRRTTTPFRVSRKIVRRQTEFRSVDSAPRRRSRSRIPIGSPTFTHTCSLALRSRSDSRVRKMP